MALFARHADGSRDPVWLLTAHAVAGTRAYFSGDFLGARREMLIGFLAELIVSQGERLVDVERLVRERNAGSTAQGTGEDVA